ncbi:MAG: DUF3795 domain-containing protein [Candidatus Thermoplasmatota archaeon]|nr:DUF3795 domain-containing protein [Candidatus Thermoplasmatota archaeon]
MVYENKRLRNTLIALKKRKIKYCFECTEFPCDRHYGKFGNEVVFDSKWLDFMKKELGRG